jgi:hypothetical protein
MSRKLVGSALVLGTAYFTQDAFNDTIMYLRARSKALELCNNNPQIISDFGPPLHSSWHDASVAFSHSAKIATLHIPIIGEKRSTDLKLVLIRKGGLRWSLLYNILSGDWTVMVADVQVGMGPGGRPQYMSLIPRNEGVQEEEERYIRRET